MPIDSLCSSAKVVIKWAETHTGSGCSVHCIDVKSCSVASGQESILSGVCLRVMSGEP